MTDKVKVKRLLSLGNGLLTTSMAAKSGIHRQQLVALEKAGVIERASRGIYVFPGEIDDKLFWLQQRAKKIIYSHETALFLHRMTNRTPNHYTITVPSSYKVSAAQKKDCKIYYINQDLINLGKIKIQSGFGNQVITYNIERTICDIIRSRNRIDSQIFTETLKIFTRSKNKDLNRLYNYAKKFRVQKILHQYLEVLL